MESAKKFDAEEAADPIALFRQWLKEATESEPNDPNAMALATSTASGEPSVRMVLMKRLDEGGFSFYTNGESQKGHELAENPHAALCFHWKTRRRQVRVAGQVHELPPSDVDTYFHSRGRKSQIGAVASQQSRPLSSREVLEAEAAEIAHRYPAEIPRPEYWKGYSVKPEQIEFWEDGPDRLHNRIIFARSGDDWTKTRLYP